MIKLVRVDYRLLHGQIAVTWLAETGADCLLLVSETLRDDPIRMRIMRMAKPEGVKVVVKDRAGAVEALKSGATDKYKLFVICETVEDADAVLRATGERDLDVGNVPLAEGKVSLSRAVALDEAEADVLRALVHDGFNPYLQMVPSDKKVACADVLQ